MYKFGLFTFLFSFTFLLNSQTVLTPDWVKIDSSDEGTSEAWGVDVDENNHIFWAVSNDQLGEGLDIYCYKFENGGNAVWETPFSFGGLGTQHAYVCNASDTALYIGGRNCSGLINTCDMLLLKVDRLSGSLIWDRTLNFAANGYDEVDGLELKEDGIYCGGWSQELHSGIYRSDIGLWKLDYNGDTEWTNHLGATTTAEHQDGHFVVDNDHIFAAGLWGGTGIANLHNGYSFLGKFDKSDGELIDSTLFGFQSDSFNDIENALGMTSDGTFLYVTGYTTPVEASNWQIFVAKFDKDLNLLWYTDWGMEGTESARGIAVEYDKIYIAGLTESESIMTGGDRDAVLLELDTDGNVLSYKTYGDERKESFQDIAVKDENIYLTGTIESPSFIKKSMLVAIEGPSGSIDELNNQEANHFSVHPNPSNGNLNVSFSEDKHQAGLLQIIDPLGKVILEQPFQSTENKIAVGLEDEGIFFVRLSFPSYRITKKIINLK